MRKRPFPISFALFVLVVLIATAAAAHDVRHTVIVDADMALDDLRALAIAATAPDLDLLAVIAVDGSASPLAGARSAARLLGALDRSGVPIGVGRATGRPAPAWRPMSEAMGWADLPPENIDAPLPSATDLLRRAIRESHHEITILCLGPLTDLADLLGENPSIAERIGIVYYEGNGPDETPLSWNTARDTAAARVVFAGGFPIVSIALGRGDFLPFDRNLLDAIKRVETPAARAIAAMHADPRTTRLVDAGHFVAWDETLPLLLLEPDLATIRPVPGESDRFRLTAWNREGATRAYLRVLEEGGGPFPPRRSVVFESFPADPALFRRDVAEIAPRVIARHGMEEWKAALLTNELHRHLGIYSILGAKMGIRAREILGASLDETEVVSFTGLGPPLSCMIDGLQASTGASLGRGTIRADGENPRPEALFRKGDRAIRLRIKDELVARIRADIRRAIEEKGNLTPAYFAEVRRLSLVYWLETDRAEAFETTEEAPAAFR
ncbi:MAG: nucleoside hydrolase [Candidatus Eisenbacteria bacterium]|nr:nucleoside hydrolase [Candidatus Eisenbacteria bacterium]